MDRGGGYRVESDRYIHLETWRFRRSFDGRGARRRLNHVRNWKGGHSVTTPSGALGIRKIIFGKALYSELVEISAVIALLRRWARIISAAWRVHGSKLLNWALLWGMCVVVVALYEEFTFRGYPQFALTQAVRVLACGAAPIDRVRTGAPGQSWCESKLGLAGVNARRVVWCPHAAAHWEPMVCGGACMPALISARRFCIRSRISGVVFSRHLSNATLAGPAWLTGGSAGPEASVFDFVVLLHTFLRNFIGCTQLRVQTRLRVLPPIALSTW